MYKSRILNPPCTWFLYHSLILNIQLNQRNSSSSQHHFSNMSALPDDGQAYTDINYTRADGRVVTLQVPFSEATRTLICEVHSRSGALAAGERSAVLVAAACGAAVEEESRPVIARFEATRAQTNSSPSAHDQSAYTNPPNSSWQTISPVTATHSRTSDTATAKRFRTSKIFNSLRRRFQ
jgi:hypothetical protein